MRTQLSGMLRLDMDAVDLHKGLTGLLVILAAILFIAILGMAGLVAGLAALFVIMTDRPGPLRERGLAALAMTGFGTAIAILALRAGTEAVWMATALTFVITAVGTLAAGLGQPTAARGLLLTIWAIVALSLGGDLDEAVRLSVAYFVGGLMATGVIWLQTRGPSEASLEEEVGAASRRLEDIVRSPLGWFALLRGAAVALALAIGAILFPAHPVWGAATVLVVMRPTAGEAVAMGVLRTAGTFVGIVVAETVLALSDSGDGALLVGFLAASFGAAAFGRVNYAVMVGCLSAILVFVSELVAGAGDSAAVDRLIETVFGAGIAFVALALGRWLLIRQAAAGEGEMPARPATTETHDVPG